MPDEIKQLLEEVGSEKPLLPEQPNPDYYQDTHEYVNTGGDEVDAIFNS